MPSALHNLFHLPDTGQPLLFLAPMAGFSGAPMRRMSRRHGAALTYTEMTNDVGLLHESDRTWHLLETFEDEAPVVAHLYGSEPATLAEAAAKVEAAGRFAGIDLNAGCPVHKITANGAGAALVKDPQRVHDILAAMRRAVRLPLTVKTRLGPHPEKIMVFELLAAAEAAGADAFTLHGRFTSQGHGGDVSLDLLAEVKRRAKIPVIGNGGVRSTGDAAQMFRETGVDAVMIARAAIGNPWIFEEIGADLAAGLEEAPRGRPRRELAVVRDTLEQHIADELTLLQRVRERYDLPSHVIDIDEALVNTFRCHLFRYLQGLKGSSYVRGHMHALHTLADIRAAVASCFEREAAFRASAPWNQSAPPAP